MYKNNINKVELDNENSKLILNVNIVNEFEKVLTDKDYIFSADDFVIKKKK